MKEMKLITPDNESYENINLEKHRQQKIGKESTKKKTID